MNPRFSTAKFVGSGLIGTSIALSLKAAGVSVQMQDLDSNTERLAMDLVHGSVIDDPDLIIVSASIDVNLKLILDSLKRYPRSIVIDIASVKSNLLDDVIKLSENPQNFISSHPMAGREVSGAESARADLFLGRSWIGIESTNTSNLTKQALSDLVEICGATLYWLTANEHDQAVAAISHLPQIISTTLAYSLEEKGVNSFNLAGQGLRDVLRLSGSNPKLWGELLIANKDALQPFLSSFSQALLDLQKALESNNQKEIEEIFSVGNKVYGKIPGKHGGQKRKYSYLPIVIDDQPGQLAKIFDECAKIKVNIEDLSIEHSPGQQTGLITLALNEQDGDKLSAHLQSAGWNVHSLKVDK
jgi:prephenate dehydrogenase